MKQLALVLWSVNPVVCGEQVLAVSQSLSLSHTHTHMYTHTHTHNHLSTIIHEMFISFTVSEIHEQPRMPTISHSGYLLRRDDKYRWHRSWCRLESRDMKFSIYEDNNEEVLVKSFSVENTTPRFGSGNIPDCDKENCFAITGVTSSTSGENPTSVAMTPEGETAPPLTATSPQLNDEIYFAAYSDADLRQWKEALHMLTEPNLLEGGGSWLSPVGHDSASTSSSNFSSNRESMISTTSSAYMANNRISTRSDTLERDHPITDEIKMMSLTKQQQPLPSPPPLHVSNIVCTCECEGEKGGLRECGKRKKRERERERERE